jgi:methylthioribose-1-phosphate isomerase
VALRWRHGRLEILDQTLLPASETWLELRGAQDCAAAILRLAIRGAPNIGITAAYGLAMEVALTPDDDGVADAAALLKASRPTAVNLAWAVDRVQAAVLAVAPRERAAVARAEAEAIHAAEDAASATIARLGADLLAGTRRILTHCNTGTLACGGTGSALAVVTELAQRGPLGVLACETRPLLQGARLTIWELRRAGISHELLVDGAAAGLMRRGEVDAVIVGCDRVAANGDTANKVGTYAHALAARAAGIPFIVAGPTSTIDSSIASGDEIVIEERDADEVRLAGGRLVTLPDTPVRNPAFDVTPAELIGAIVTEHGVHRAPYAQSLSALV